MELLNLNSSPIAHERNAYSLNKKELDVVKKTKYRKPDQGLYISETISLLKNETLAPLKKFIIKKADEYTRDVLGIKDKIYLTQSWSTINNTNAFHKIHDHPNTLIGLVYYAQCESSFIRFFLDRTALREGFNFDFTIDKYNIYNSNSWDLPVEAGDIVIFPGHVRHGSMPNDSKLPRIIVGANFFIKGKLGSVENVSFITI